MNLPTLIVAIIVAAIFITVLVKEIKKHKKGNGCSCDCSSCGCSCDSCPSSTTDKK